MTGHGTHPSWCNGDHPASGVHRREVGSAKVGGETLTVVILQTDGGDLCDFTANVTISGPLFVEINRDDHDDAVRLFTLAGQNQLAALVQRAAAILKAADR